MTLFKRLLTMRMRRTKRFNAKTGFYVTYDQSLSKNQIENLSMGGLSFYYVDNGFKIDSGSYELSLIDRNRVYLGKVPFKTVSDTEVGEIMFRNKRVKRQSVCFDHLTTSQEKQLTAIIDQFTEKATQ